MNASPNLWLWFGPYVGLLLFMVYAMMEFTASLLIQYPPQKRTPLSAHQLRQQLLDASAQFQPYTVAEKGTSDLELRSQHTYTIERPYLRLKRTLTDRIRILLDEERHEVRINSESFSSGYRFGRGGWLPFFGIGSGYSAGPPGMHPVTRTILTIAHKAGWSYRPVILPIQVSRKALQRVRKIVPAPLHKASPRLIWGIVYPLSYLLALGWFFGMGDATIRTPANFALTAAISLVWWGLWAVIAWMLCGFPRFWQRKARQ